MRSIVLGRLGLDLIERYRDITRNLLRREPDGWLLSYDAGVAPMRAKPLGQAITDLGKGLGLTVTTHSFGRVSATQLPPASRHARSPAPTHRPNTTRDQPSAPPRTDRRR